jgi:hypothetical protein
MSAKEDMALVQKMAELARHSPGCWSEFLEEFRKYADRVKDGCVMSPIDMLQINSGRARESATLLEMATECVRISDAYAAKLQQK